MSETQGGKNFRSPGSMQDPLVVLGQLRTEMAYQRELTKDNADLLGKVADDVTEIKITLAKQSGEKEGINWGAKVINGVLILIASGVSAYATVKALALPTH